MIKSAIENNHDRIFAKMGTLPKNSDPYTDRLTSEVPRLKTTDGQQIFPILGRDPERTEIAIDRNCRFVLTVHFKGPWNR